MASGFRDFFILFILSIFIGACTDTDKTEGIRVDVFDQLNISEISTPIELPKMVKSNSWGGPVLARSETLNYFFNGEPEKGWSFDLDVGRILSSPIIYDDKIIVLGDRGLLKCLDLNTQEVLWEYSIAPNDGSKETIIGGGLSYDLAGNLYATTSVGEVLSFTIKTGNLNWRYEIDAPIMDAPTVIDNTIFLTDVSNVSRSISSRGNLNWVVRGIPYNQIRANTGQPVPAGDLLLLSSSSGILSAVDKETGFQQWDFRFTFNRAGFTQNTFGFFNGHPVVYDDKIYFGSVSGQFNALKLDGDVLWEINIGLQGTPLLLSNSIFFVSDTNNLIRLNKRNGTLIWSKK